MDGISRPSGAGIPISFNGETFVVPPLKLTDFGVIENHMRAKQPNILKMAAEALECLPEKMRQAAWNDALIAARKSQNIPPEDVLEFITGTIEGISLALSIMIERVRPGKYNINDIQDIIQSMASTNAEELADLKNRYMMASGLTTEGNSTGPTPSGQAAGQAESGHQS